VIILLMLLPIAAVKVHPLKHIIGFLVGLPWVWSASDDEAFGSWHDAADPAALLPLQSDWILSPQL